MMLIYQHREAFEEFARFKKAAACIAFGNSLY